MSEHEAVNLTDLPPTPEHDKFAKVRSEPLGEHLSGFYDYLREQGMHLMVWVESDEEADCLGDWWNDTCIGAQCPACHGSRVVPRHFEGYVAAGRNPAELIAGYLGIDYKAFNDETEAVFQAISRLAEAEGS
jgi:hypothetical protein